MPKTLYEQYALPPVDIERVSQTRIADAYGAELARFGAQREFALRLVYAAGDPGLLAQLRLHPRLVEAGVAALRAGAPIVTDVRMVAAGISAGMSEALGCTLQCAIDDPAVALLANDRGVTRSAAAVDALLDQLEGAVVAIGNAPTFLLRLLDYLDEGAPSPAVILAFPVGFVAASEAKQALVDRGHIGATVLGTRGGSPLAAAAVNTLLRAAQA